MVRHSFQIINHLFSNMTTQSINIQTYTIPKTKPWFHLSTPTVSRVRSAFVLHIYLGGLWLHGEYLWLANPLFPGWSLLDAIPRHRKLRESAWTYRVSEVEKDVCKGFAVDGDIDVWRWRWFSVWSFVVVILSDYGGVWCSLLSSFVIDCHIVLMLMFILL